MNEEKNEMAIVKTEPQPSTAVSIFDTAGRFEHYQRVAKAFASSDLVPTTFKNNIPNVLIALDMADRLRANPLMVMQSVFVICGKPSWASTFIISCINSCGRFEPLRFELTGQGEDRSCIAWTRARGTTERIESPPVTMRMARAEGWLNRSGSKWQTMPELMLRYRAATFFGRLYCPELLLGMRTDDEVIDVEGAESVNPWKPTHGPKLFESPALPKSEPIEKPPVEDERELQDMGLAPKPAEPHKMTADEIREAARVYHPPPPGPPQPEPSAEEIVTDAVVSWGYNWDQFADYLVETKIDVNAKSLPGFADVDWRRCKKLSVPSNLRAVKAWMDARFSGPDQFTRTEELSPEEQAELQGEINDGR